MCLVCLAVSAKFILKSRYVSRHLFREENNEIRRVFVIMRRINKITCLMLYIFPPGSVRQYGVA